MTRGHLAAAIAAGLLSRRLRPRVLEHLSEHAAEQLAQHWRPRRRIGPIRLGRYAIALAATTDTTATIGETSR